LLTAVLKAESKFDRTLKGDPSEKAELMRDYHRVLTSDIDRLERWMAANNCNPGISSSNANNANNHNDSYNSDSNSNSYQCRQIQALIALKKQRREQVIGPVNGGASAPGTAVAAADSLAHRWQKIRSKVGLSEGIRDDEYQQSDAQLAEQEIFATHVLSKFARAVIHRQPDAYAVLMEPNMWNPAGGEINNFCEDCRVF
jgi:hypothetical protein